MELPVALTAAFETACNRVLSLDPNSAARMSALQGKVIAIVVQDLHLRLYLLPGPGGMQALSHYEHAPDAVLHATPAALWNLTRGGEAAHMMLRDEIRVEGDTQLGQDFKSLLDQLDIDWEEHLSGVLGDVLAHQISRGVQAGMRWNATTVSSLEQDVSEFVQEEARLVPSGPEVTQFMDDVDELRADADRLEVRLNRLLARLVDAGSRS